MLLLRRVCALGNGVDTCTCLVWMHKSQAHVLQKRINFAQIQILPGAQQPHQIHKSGIRTLLLPGFKTKQNKTALQIVFFFFHALYNSAK